MSLAVIAIRRLAVAEGWEQLGALAAVLVDCVAGGASVGFLAGYEQAEAERFFAGVLGGVERGERMLWAAFVNGQLEGTVQVVTAMPPNQPHRGEVTKMLVHRRARGKGVGRALLREAEQGAREAGKTLLVLDTVEGDAGERLYRAAGWSRAGLIPRYALYPDGRPCDTVVFYKELGAADAPETEPVQYVLEG